MIASDIWRDEFIGNLDLLGRLLWIGLIVTCADDQGRLSDNSILIRSDVFPLDDIPVADIEARLIHFEDTQRIYRYQAEGKNIIQIINWWEYQTPSWASPSKYRAPDNWIDREKYHTVGNKIAGKNWDMQGGFTQLPSELPSQLPSALNDVKGEVKGEDESPPPFELLPEIALVREVTNLIPDINNEPLVINNVQACRKRLKQPPREVVLAELKDAWACWCSSETTDGKPYNPGNWAWTEWAATGHRSNGRKPAQKFAEVY